MIHVASDIPCVSRDRNQDIEDAQPVTRDMKIVRCDVIHDPWDVIHVAGDMIHVADDLMDHTYDIDHVDGDA